MARRRNPVPSYLPHKQSGRARAVWTDATGTRHFRMLPGPFNSPASRAAFDRLELELLSSPLGAVIADPNGITINELLCGYAEHVETYYRDPDGKPTDEIRHIKTVSAVLREVYGTTPATSFGPLALKAVRQKFVERGWCRTTVNRMTGRVVSS